MSPQDLTSIAHAVYDEFNARDLASAAGRFSRDLELYSVATGSRFRGREGYLQHAQGWAAAFPDGHVEILYLTVHRHSATVEYLLRGTHTGALISEHGHIPPTWSQVELRFCDVLEFEGPEIARVRSYYDTATLLRQMGLFPGSPLHAPDRRAPLDLYALEVDAPPAQRNKGVVQRFVERVLNDRSPRAAVDLCVPNFAWHGGPLGEIRDLSAYQQQLASLFLSFPNLRTEVLDLVAEEDRVVARLLFRGTHLGDFRGIPPTYKRIVTQATSTFRVVDGHIVEEWSQQDLVGVMQQMEVMPSMVRLSSVAER